MPLKNNERKLRNGGLGNGECVSPFAPPVMQLHCKICTQIFSISLHHLHPNSRILSEGQIQFKRVARQNPPVLRSPESACSRIEQPLSADRGRKKSNTLDFLTENRVPTGRFHPYWKPRIKGICNPFENPAHLCICTHKLKNDFVSTNP